MGEPPCHLRVARASTDRAPGYVQLDDHAARAHRPRPRERRTVGAQDDARLREDPKLAAEAERLGVDDAAPAAEAVARLVQVVRVGHVLSGSACGIRIGTFPRDLYARGWRDQRRTPERAT
eukprot:5079989-Prymnesium_polylepis.1